MCRFIQLKDNDGTYLNVMEVVVITKKYEDVDGTFKRYVELILKSGYVLKLYYNDVEKMVRDIVDIKHNIAQGNI